MEDHAIKALDDVAASYADIRDQRMELTRDEVTLKANAMKLMKKYGKTSYKHDGIEIAIVPGEEGIKVKIKKAVDEERAEGDDIEIHGETLADA